MKRFVLLPNGDRIRSDIITAIRKGDAEPANECCKTAMVPRVIVDFGQESGGPWGGGGNSTICYCETDEQWDKLADRIYAEIYGEMPIKGATTARVELPLPVAEEENSPPQQGDIVAVQPRTSLWQKTKNALAWLEGQR